MPTIERRDLTAHELQLTISIKKEEYLPKLDADLKKFKNRAAMKGFRPGHTPMAVVKKMYGQGLMAETVNDLTVKELYKYLGDEKLPVIFQPIPSKEQDANVMNINDPRDFAFKFDIGLEPQFEIQGLSKDQVFEKMTLADLDKLAEEDLEYARKRMAERIEATDNVQLDDIIKIDAREANKPDGYATELSFLIKSIPSEDLRAYFLTKKAGDSVRFHPREAEAFEDDKKYRRFVLGLDDKDNREISELFEGKITKAERVVLPEIDQAFFDKYFGEGQVTSREEAMEKVKSNVAKYYEGQAEGLLMVDFKNRLMEINRFEMPETFLKKWVLQADEKNTPEAVEAGFPGLLESLRWTFMSEKMKAQFGIEITKNDVVAAFEDRVRGYFGGSFAANAEQMEGIVKSTALKLAEDEKQAKDIEETLFYDRLFRAIAERVSIVEKPVPSAALQARITEVNQRNQAQNEQ